MITFKVYVTMHAKMVGESFNTRCYTVPLSEEVKSELLKWLNYRSNDIFIFNIRMYDYDKELYPFRICGGSYTDLFKYSDMISRILQDQNKLDKLYNKVRELYIHNIGKSQFEDNSDYKLFDSNDIEML